MKVYQNIMADGDIKTIGELKEYIRGGNYEIDKTIILNNGQLVDPVVLNSEKYDQVQLGDKIIVLLTAKETSWQSRIKNSEIKTVVTDLMEDPQYGFMAKAFFNSLTN